jgi:hypothetical protein
LIVGNLIGSHQCYLYSTHLRILTCSHTSVGDGDETTTLISTTRNGENKKIDDRKKRLEKKYQLRALCSEGQYEDEAYTADEGMFQEPILQLDYYLVIILMYDISTIQMCLCLCVCFLIVTLNRVHNVLGQSM